MKKGGEPLQTLAETNAGGVSLDATSDGVSDAHIVNANANVVGDGLLVLDQDANTETLLDMHSNFAENPLLEICLRELARGAARRSETTGEGSNELLGESRNCGAPPNSRKHGRDTPSSTETILTPKRACAKEDPFLQAAAPEREDASSTLSGPPPPYASQPATPASQAWGDPPPLIAWWRWDSYGCAGGGGKAAIA